jgi:hypothetical protein
MSESQDKNLPATERKLQKTREEARVRARAICRIWPFWVRAHC